MDWLDDLLDLSPENVSSHDDPMCQSQFQENDFSHSPIPAPNDRSNSLANPCQDSSDNFQQHQGISRQVSKEYQDQASYEDFSPGLGDISRTDEGEGNHEPSRTASVPSVNESNPTPPPFAQGTPTSGASETTITITKPEGTCQSLCPTKKKHGPIVLCAKDCHGNWHHICRSCACIGPYTLFRCYGCQQDFDKFDKWRRFSRYHPSCKSEPSKKNKIHGDKRGNESIENTKRQEKKARLLDTNQQQTLSFLKDCGTFFESDYKEVQFHVSGEENRSVVLRFNKPCYVNFTPQHSGYICLTLSEVYPQLSVRKEILACDTRMSTNDPWFMMEFEIPSWSPSVNGVHFAKVNIAVTISKEKKITSKIGSLETVLKSVHWEKDRITSDILFTNINMNSNAEPVDSPMNPDFDSLTASSSRTFSEAASSYEEINTAIESMTISERVRNNWVPFDIEVDDESKKKWLLQLSRFSGRDPCGYSPIEYCIAHSDSDGLEYVLRSDQFDLSVRDIMGYTKEFWCYYFDNMKALEMIQDAKIRNMNLSQLIDLDSVVLNILSFVDCGLILNFALHEEKIYRYLTKRETFYSSSQETNCNPYKTLFGRFKSGNVHMLYLDQPMIGRSAEVGVSELNYIASRHELIDFAPKHCVVHIVCSDTSSKIISTEAIKKMVSKVKMIGCEYGSERCNSHKNMSQSVTCDFASHSTLNWDDLGTSVHSIQLVDSSGSDMKSFESSVGSITHAILGPQLHVDDSFDVEQFITGCENLQHLELNDVTYQDEETIYDFWEGIGEYATKLKKISLHLKSQRSMHASQIEEILVSCPSLEHLSIVTEQGTHVVNGLITQFSHARPVKSIDLKYESCDEEVLKKFMILYGNVCDVAVTTVHNRNDKRVTSGLLQSVKVGVFFFYVGNKNGNTNYKSLDRSKSPNGQIVWGGKKGKTPQAYEKEVESLPNSIQCFLFSSGKQVNWKEKSETLPHGKCLLVAKGDAVIQDSNEQAMARKNAGWSNADSYEFVWSLKEEQDVNWTTSSLSKLLDLLGKNQLKMKSKFIELQLPSNTVPSFIAYINEQMKEHGIDPQIHYEEKTDPNHKRAMARGSTKMD